MGEERQWIGPAEPDDDEDFLAIVGRVLHRLSRTGDDLHLVRIDNWFGPKWLGFAGKLLGTVGVRTDVERGALVVPPFSPGRVVWERHLSSAGGEYFPVESPRKLHGSRPSGSNLFRRLAHLQSPGHFVWYSGKSRANARGSLMVASLYEADQGAYFVEFCVSGGQWRVGSQAGSSPMTSSELLSDETASSLLVYGERRIATVVHESSDFPTLYGTYVLIEDQSADQLLAHVRDYVAMSVESWPLVEAGEYDEDAMAAEDPFMDLINSDRWALVDTDGRRRSIQAPVFETGGRINWRWF